MIRTATPADAPAICAIYNRYVAASVATFEEHPVSVAGMGARIAEVTQTLPWLVVEDRRTVTGYAYATAWKPRRAYRYTVETTIYMDPTACGRGLGATLYGALITALEARGVHCALAGIALPNPASIALHERLGFRRVGRLEQVGWKLDRWVDVGYWQRILEACERPAVPGPDAD